MMSERETMLQRAQAMGCSVVWKATLVRQIGPWSGWIHRPDGTGTTPDEALANAVRLAESYGPDPYKDVVLHSRKPNPTAVTTEQESADCASTAREIGRGR